MTNVDLISNSIQHCLTQKNDLTPETLINFAKNSPGEFSFPKTLRRNV